MRQVTQREIAEQAFVQLSAWIIKTCGGMTDDATKATHNLSLIMFHAGFTPDDLHRILFSKEPPHAH